MKEHEISFKTNWVEDFLVFSTSESSNNWPFQKFIDKIHLGKGIWNILGKLYEICFPKTSRRSCWYSFSTLRILPQMAFLKSHLQNNSLFSTLLVVKVNIILKMLCSMANNWSSTVTMRLWSCRFKITPQNKQLPSWTDLFCSLL